VNGTFREAVEDANDVLLGPFATLVDGSDNRWVTHGVPTILALILYGFCLGMLARMLPKSREHGADWRTVES
jgi:arginine exporter protein ArgO